MTSIKTQTDQSHSKGSKTTIVGGGLVGAMTATLLAKAGHKIDVYEKRSDPRTSAVERGRSINLIMTARGLKALDHAGCGKQARALAVAVYGRMIHDISGNLHYQPYGRDRSFFNYAVSRTDLNNLLLDEAERFGVKFHFGMNLESIDFEQQSLKFLNTQTHTHHQTIADHLLGCDGAGSRVRELLLSHLDASTTLEPLVNGYKELEISAKVAQAFRLNQEALHIWPRQHLMMMALPNRDGSLTVTLYLPQTGNDSFASLKTASDVTTLFDHYFPDARELIPDVAESFFENPVGNLCTLQCQPWYYKDFCCILGDAAHAIVPFFGQGMNSGFEDCMALLRHWEESPNQSEIFMRFYQERKPNADAIAAMSLENFYEMSAKVADPNFLLMKAVEHAIEDRWPDAYQSRYSMVAYSHIPYAEAYQRSTAQKDIIAKLCQGISHVNDLDWNLALKLLLPNQSRIK